MPKERRPAKVAARVTGLASRRATKGLTKAEARKIALSLEGAEERPHFRKPAVFVGEDFITRVHDKEAAMVLPVAGIEMRDMMLEAEPELFYITEHYRNFPVILARLSAPDKKTLKDLLAARLLRLAERAGRKRPKKKPPARKGGGK